MKNKLIFISIHILFWICTSWLITSSFSIQAHEIEMINGVENVTIVRSNGLIFQLLLCIVVALLLFYFNTRLILHFQRVNTKVMSFSGLSFWVALLSVFLISKFHIFGKVPSLPNQISFGIIVFYYAIAMAYGLAKLWFLNEKRHQQMLLEKEKADLNLLRNQLQPHFLFNALNNLLSMVDPIQHPKLATSFERLSGLLRYVIEETKADKVTIADEINFLNNYIELQLLRFNDDEINILFLVEGENNMQKIEPGLFIPFVENAFKYGTQPEQVSAIEIYFNLKHTDSIQFSIKNNIQIEGKSGFGTGLSSVEKRLALIYPHKHTLLITQNDYYLVELNITTL